MSTLEDTVMSVVVNFVNNNELFTALDVSNEVKKVVPLARHRVVRDVVRNLWTSDIEPNSYARTTIDVNLADGTVVQALLYHPLSDSWDLDAKYDAQKRSQASNKSASPLSNSAPIAYTPIDPRTVGTLASGTSLSVQATPTTNPVPATQANPWSVLFGTQPSLFPRR